METRNCYKVSQLVHIEILRYIMTSMANRVAQIAKHLTTSNEKGLLDGEVVIVTGE